MYHMQLDVLQLLEDVSPLIQEASSVLTRKGLQALQLVRTKEASVPTNHVELNIEYCITLLLNYPFT